MPKSVRFSVVVYVGLMISGSIGLYPHETTATAVLPPPRYMYGIDLIPQHMRDAVGRNAGHATGDVVGDATGDAIGDTVGDAVGDAALNDTGASAAAPIAPDVPADPAR